MSQPLYFLPNLNRAQIAPEGRFSRAILKQRGIDDVFADCLGAQDCQIAEVNSGPENRSGVLLCYQRAGDGALPQHSLYQPDHQTWRAVHSDSLWIGFDANDPPSEKDLRRKAGFFQGGWEVNLTESEAWLVPVIRQPDGGTGLPTDMFFDSAGNYCSEVKERYRQYWEESAESCKLFSGGETPISELITNERALYLAIRALGINYRFGNNEQRFMRLIDSGNVMLVLFASIDRNKVRMVEDAQKKTQSVSTSDALNTMPGQTDDCQTTDRAAAICT